MVIYKYKLFLLIYIYKYKYKLITITVYMKIVIMRGKYNALFSYNKAFHFAL